MPNPICVKCKREMFVQKNEVAVKDKADSLEETTVWLGDVFECPGCKFQMIAGFGYPFRNLEQIKLFADEALEFIYD